MLYGSDKFVSKSLKTIEDYCLKRDYTLVFGATVNSIGNRIQRYDSDYDGKFIYYINDLDNKYITIDEAYKKCDRSGRFYIDVNKELGEATPWEPALLWNSRSFMSLLVNPSNEIRNIIPAVYYQVLNVFSSPFYLDNFGIRKQIKSRVEEIIDFNYLLLYFKNRMGLRSERDDKGRMLLKYYLSAIHCLLSMHWILVYECVPPYTIDALYYLCRPEIIDRINELRAVIDRKQRLLSADKSGPIVQAFKTDSEFKEIQMVNDDLLDSFIDEKKMFINELWDRKREQFFKRITIEQQVNRVNDCIDIISDKINKNFSR